MRVAVVFDTPYSGWDHPDHERHQARLLGVRDDLEYLVRHLSEWSPDLVFNDAEAFSGDESLEYLLPGLLEAEGCRYTGAPPLGLQVTRNKAISKKILAYFGVSVPGFVSYRLHEEVTSPPALTFPLIVKPLQADASAGTSQASVVREADALADRVSFIHQRLARALLPRSPLTAGSST